MHIALLIVSSFGLTIAVVMMATTIRMLQNRASNMVIMIGMVISLLAIPSAIGLIQHTALALDPWSAPRIAVGALCLLWVVMSAGFLLANVAEFTKESLHGNR